MQNKIKSILNNKEFYWTLIFQIGTLVGGILLMKFLAYSLPKEGYGFYALITSVTSLVLMLPFTALSQGLIRYISIFQESDHYKEFISNILVLFVLIVLLYLIGGLFFWRFYSIEEQWEQSFFWILLYIISEVFKIFFRTTNNANRERKNIALSVIIEFVLKLSILYLIFKFSNVSISIVLIAFCIGNGISVSIMYSKNKHSFSLAFINLENFYKYSLPIWKFSSPLMVLAVFGWFRDMANRWYLDYFMDKEQVALFAMMASLALVVPTGIQGVIGSFFVPIIYQNENGKNGYTRKLLFRLLPIVTFLFFLGFIFVFFLKDMIVRLFTDEKYLMASWMLPWLFLTYCFYAISMLSTFEIYAKKKTKKLIMPTVLSGIISLIAGYFLIKNYNLNGAMYNYILTYNCHSLLTFFTVYKFTKLDKS